MAGRRSILGGANPERVALLLLGNLVVGVGAPFLIDAMIDDPVTGPQHAILALLIFCVLTIVEVLLRVEQVYALRLGEFNVWKQRNNIESALGGIRSGLHDLIADAGMRDTFFLDHYQRELDLLNRRVEGTITNREILIDRHHIDSTYVLLSIYDSPEHGAFRATAVCGDVGDDFDVTYEVYFNEWLKRMKNGTVADLRRIFIYSSPLELERPNVRKLLAFHAGATPGLRAKVVPAREFSRFKADYRVQEPTLDIGIFSDQYLYLGRTRSDDNISGFFSRDQRLISAYTSVFDGVWESAWASPVTQYETSPITAAQLFDANFSLPEKTEPHRVAASSGLEGGSGETGQGTGLESRSMNDSK